MKEEIKNLYKRNPKLAKQVAKVLNYTIKVKKTPKSVKSALSDSEIMGVEKKVLKPWKQIASDITSTNKEWQEIMKDQDVHVVTQTDPEVVSSISWKIEKALPQLLESLENFLRNQKRLRVR